MLTVLAGTVRNVDVLELSQNLADAVLGEVYGSITVGQSFVSTYAGLDAIAVLMATYSRTNTNDLVFHLRHSVESGQDIRTIVTNSSQIVDNSYHTFAFPAIPDSEAQSYYFFIESPRATPGNAVTVYYTTSNAYADGSAYVNHKPIVGDLAFREYRETRLQGIFQNLCSCFGARVQPETYFFVFYAGLLILLAIVALESKLKSRRRQKTHPQ